MMTALNTHSPSQTCREITSFELVLSGKFSEITLFSVSVVQWKSSPQKRMPHTYPVGEIFDRYTHLFVR
jgi:hypothetical protein